jgi:hypothetical protein
MIPARVLRHGTQIGIWHLKIKNKNKRNKGEWVVQAQEWLGAFETVYSTESKETFSES